MSKVYDIVLQRYRDKKTRVCGKDSIPLIKDFLIRTDLLIKKCTKYF